LGTQKRGTKKEVKDFCSYFSFADKEKYQKKGRPATRPAAVLTKTMFTAAARTRTFGRSNSVPLGIRDHAFCSASLQRVFKTQNIKPKNSLPDLYPAKFCFQVWNLILTPIGAQPSRGHYQGFGRYAV